MNMSVAQDVIAGVVSLLSELKTCDQAMINETVSFAEALQTEHRRLAKFKTDGYISSQRRKIGQRLESAVVEGQTQQRKFQRWN